MGFFGLFGGGKSGPGAVKRHADRATNKRAQAPDRMESIHALASIGTGDAAEALLPRFKFTIEPSITDQEEKDVAFHGIVRAGEDAVQPVLAYMRKAESISWPLKILDQILPSQTVIGHLIDLLATMDTEYERDPQRKIQVLGALEERKDERIVDAVLRFTDDANETVRFHATGAVFAQAVADAARETLAAAFPKEDSVRVRVRICEGFAERGWSFGEKAPPKDRIPTGWFLDPQGVPKRSTKPQTSSP
jgi:hypothetical protein